MKLIVFSQKFVGMVGFPAISPNVRTLGEGGEFYHKYQCVERMLNIAVNVERSTAPPLLPNVCYAFGLFLTKLKFEI